MIWNILILNHSNRNISIFWERVPFSALLKYAAVTGQRCESTFHCSNLSECDWFWSNSPGTKPASAVYCVGRAWNPPRWRIKMESSIVKVQSVKWDRKISASSISLISLNQSIDSLFQTDLVFNSQLMQPRAQILFLIVLTKMHGSLFLPQDKKQKRWLQFKSHNSNFFSRNLEKKKYISKLQNKNIQVIITIAGHKVIINFVLIPWWKEKKLLQRRKKKVGIVRNKLCKCKLMVVRRECCKFIYNNCEIISRNSEKKSEFVR